MIRTYLCLLIFSLFYTLSYSQELHEELITPSLDFGINIFVGGQFSDFEELNKILTTEGFPEAKSDFIQFGAGLNYIYGRHYLRFKYYAALNDHNKDINNFRTTTFGYGAEISYGYGFDFPFFRLLPYTGLTNNSVNIELQELPTSSNNFQNQLSILDITKLKSEALSIVLGVKFFIPNDWETMFTTIDLGYHLPYKSEWTNGDFEIAETPKINVGGFTVGVEILFTTGNNSW